jgi:hypothetical protein
VGADEGEPVSGLELMLNELESSQLEVALVPCRVPVNSGGCIRVAVSKNCFWYREFCRRHVSSRFRRNAAVDTKIKRRDVLRLLRRLIGGRSTLSVYAVELRAIARRLEQDELRRANVMRMSA